MHGKESQRVCMNERLRSSWCKAETPRRHGWHKSRKGNITRQRRARTHTCSHALTVAQGLPLWAAQQHKLPTGPRVRARASLLLPRGLRLLCRGPLQLLDWCASKDRLHKVLDRVTPVELRRSTRGGRGSGGAVPLLLLLLLHVRVKRCLLLRMFDGRAAPRERSHGLVVIALAARQQRVPEDVDGREQVALLGMGTATTAAGVRALSVRSIGGRARHHV